MLSFLPQIVVASGLAAGHASWLTAVDLADLTAGLLKPSLVLICAEPLRRTDPSPLPNGPV